MIDRSLLSKHTGRIFTCLIFFICNHRGLIAQDAAGTQGSSSSLHVRHILGFEGMSNNASGDLSIQGGCLRLQRPAGASSEVPVASIQNVTLGVQDRQMGGVPMTLAKSATPFGGGRAISLVAHKKYDTVTLEYVDSDGGFHGAIFELDKGNGQVLRSQLEGAAAHLAPVQDGTAKASQEISNDTK